MGWRERFAYKVNDAVTWNRFGSSSLVDRETMGPAEVGRAIGLSGERVRQIEAVALRKLRAAFAICAFCDVPEADRILLELRGRPLAAYIAALADVAPRRGHPGESRGERALRVLKSLEEP